MEPVVDVVGHFGTRFSFSDVATNVCGALASAERLGSVWNLDQTWHEDLLFFRRERKEQGSHVLLFTAPNHYIDVYAGMYGRERSAIYMSPNTGRLADEHAMTCAKFSTVFVPSKWCETVVRSHVPDVECYLTPLGVDQVYVDGAREAWEARRARLYPSSSSPVRVVHFSTDQSWPGRKGTEELLDAWARLRPGVRAGASLRIHIQPALYQEAMYRVRDLGLAQDVELLLASKFGSPRHVSSLLLDSDLVVAPSRCEGFGLILLASLVGRVPLCCTYNTGHADFLSAAPGWLGIPTNEDAEMSLEEGLVPRVDPHVLASTLDVVIRPSSVFALNEQYSELSWSNHGSWGLAIKGWNEAIESWLEATS